MAAFRVLLQICAPRREAIIRLQAAQGTLRACTFNATVDSQCAECTPLRPPRQRLTCHAQTGN